MHAAANVSEPDPRQEHIQDLKRHGPTAPPRERIGSFGSVQRDVEEARLLHFEGLSHVCEAIEAKVPAGDPAKEHFQADSERH